MFKIEPPGVRPVRDATYQILKLYAIQFQRRRILKFSFFVPVLKLMTPVAGTVLILGASYEQTVSRCTMKYQSFTTSSFREEEFWSFPS